MSVIFTIYCDELGFVSYTPHYFKLQNVTHMEM